MRGLSSACVSFLTIVSTASLIVTLCLAHGAAKYGILQKNDALSFQAPHLQAEAAGAMLSRRNLSESYISGNGFRNVMSESERRMKLRKMQAWQQQQQQKQEKLSTDDNRPSGVVYQYIIPPPINMTARLSLYAQFPNLPDIDAPVSTALCGIVKDAEPYLDEWVDYHFGLGFHTIYLIDNSKEHELQKWQNKRRDLGYSVRVMPKPGTHRQMYGYHMCAAEHKGDHTYMAFFDVDEFMVLKKHETINEFLTMHLPKGALAISWFIFGAGYTSMYAPLPVTKRFTYRDGVEKSERHKQWGNVKSIVKTSDYGGYPQSPHSMKTNRKTAGTDKAWLDTTGGGDFDKIGAVNSNRPVDVAVIHHYKYLSPKEFYWKSCVRKTVDDQFKDCGSGYTTPYKGKIHDDSAWQMLKKNVPKYAMYDAFEDFM
eukprot:CAMPEP_0183716150 /NCGR_PEP_ID=MMETSP0737-20130205/10159_1 /TAXON_ID=385413 /ORGANISM="Thalassiosira miniscula, Strain CCMP1093" /LENGTH=425 /DNA_ID=CAMNT_0025945369 /DNA_START=99 /DNA_END=1376 /DNA_ORIENTATION=+